MEHYKHVLTSAPFAVLSRYSGAFASNRGTKTQLFTTFVYHIGVSWLFAVAECLRINAVF